MRCINLLLRFVVSEEDESIFSNLSITSYLPSRRVKPSISHLIKLSLVHLLLRILAKPLLNLSQDPLILIPNLALPSPLPFVHSLPPLPPFSHPLRFALLLVPLINDLFKYATKPSPVKLPSTDTLSFPSPNRNLSIVLLSNRSFGLQVHSRCS